MDFSFDPEAVDLASGLRELFAKSLGSAVLRRAVGDPTARRDVWRSAADLGLHSVLIDERAGGLGLGWEAAVLLLRELGRAAAPGPFIDSIAVAPALLQTMDDDRARVLLGEIASGEQRVVVSDGGRPLASAEDATLVLAVEGTRLSAFAPREGSFVPVPSLDDAMPLHRLRPGAERTPVLDVALPEPVIARARAAGAVAAAAELVGVASRIVELTRDYVAQREQFGRVIGSFQAVQHPLADAAVLTTFAGPVVDAASWALATDQPDYAVAVSHAKHAATTAAMTAARTGFQLHGAMGYTYEYDLQIWMKRARTLAMLYGTDSEHLAVLREAVPRLGRAAAVGGRAPLSRAVPAR